MSGPVILVTGASGFLGRHLIKALSLKGIETIKVSRALGYDIRDYSSLETLPPFDVMVHLAAKTFVPDSYDNRLSFFQTNATGTLNCLELCKRRGARMVFASTYVYGRPEEIPVSESHPVDPWQPYAASKVIAEQFCRTYARFFGVPSLIMRIFNMYGPGQDARFLIPTIVRGALNGQVTLKNTSTRRDFIYVSDVADAFVMAAHVEHTGCREYNLGFGHSYSIMEVVDKVLSTEGISASLSVEGVERPDDIKDVVADISRARAELQWRPQYDFDTGLSEYIEYEKENSGT